MSNLIDLNILKSLSSWEKFEKVWETSRNCLRDLGNWANSSKSMKRRKVDKVWECTKKLWK